MHTRRFIIRYHIYLSIDMITTTQTKEQRYLHTPATESIESVEKHNQHESESEPYKQKLWTGARPNQRDDKLDHCWRQTQRTRSWNEYDSFPRWQIQSLQHNMQNNGTLIGNDGRVFENNCRKNTFEIFFHIVHLTVIVLHTHFSQCFFQILLLFYISLFVLMIINFSNLLIDIFIFRILKIRLNKSD